MVKLLCLSVNSETVSAPNDLNPIDILLGEAILESG
jgi:hypothetical protein